MPAPTLTSLPQHDPDPIARAASLAAERDRYRYTWHRPEGVASAAEVPRSDAFDLGVLTRYVGVQAMLAAHDMITTSAHRVGQLVRHHEVATAAGQSFDERLAGAMKLVVRGGEHRATPSVALKWFGADVPSLIAILAAHPERHDELFAWQRLGGANPFALRRLETTDAAAPFDEAHFAAAAKAHAIDGTLASAIDGKRLFHVDFRYLDGARDGGLALEIPKRVFGARALFVQHLGPSPRFLPVAIQCVPSGPIFTPADGIGWSMAKLVLQCADTHEQALTYHVAQCHFVMEAFTLACVRAFAPAHPIRKLLAPHTQYTLAIDAQVRDTLMKPGQDLEALMATTLGQSILLVEDAMHAFDVNAAMPHADVKRRGLDDPGTLPHCPLRDDGLPVWSAIRRFVGEYVGLYYTSDADVVADSEARAFGQELGARWGGRLASIPEVTSVTTLVDLVSYAIWTASPLHAICNDSQLEFMACSANMPTALYGNAPTTSPTEADLLALYAPEEISMSQYAFFCGQTKLEENKLGEYPPDAFDDPRVAPLITRFVAELASLDARIDARNASRPAPYVWLRTQTMRASIHA
ncbi:MAG: hypothetical protein J0L92_13105 [Deltaproteobacteria bacterium]|nr:hypothetical protein [Deltaproteobacteria bacterium]